MRIPFFPQRDFEEISFDDIQRFCESGARENSMLDYKKEVSRAITKTICAMANSTGGVIIIGVEEGKDDKPKTPCTGCTGTAEGEIEKIENYTAEDMWPPVIFKAKKIESADSSHYFILISIAPSILGPHRMLHDDTVPIRVTQRSVSGPGSKGESRYNKNASPERIFDMIKKGEEAKKLKAEILKTSNDRALGELMANKASIVDLKHLKSHIQITSAVSVINLPLFHYTRLIDIFNSKIQYKNGYDFPPSYRLRSVIHGAFSFHYPESANPFHYIEINTLGLINYLTRLGEPVEGYTVMEIVDKLSLFLDLTYKAFCDIGQYNGAVELKISLNNIKGVKAYFPSTDSCSSADVNVSIEECFPIEDLNHNRERVVVDILKKLCWAIGCNSNVETELYSIASNYEKAT